MSNARNLGNITTGGATGATTASVTTSINNLIDAAPGALNTLNELAAALGDDANFSTTVTNSIATKLNLTGGTLTGDLTISSGTSGDATLTIEADTDNNNEFDNPKILFKQDGGYEAGGLRMSNNNTILWNGISDASALPGSGGGGISFNTGSASGQNNATIKMHISTDGNVGIGTISPTSKLHVDNGDVKIVGDGQTSGGACLQINNTNTSNLYPKAIEAYATTLPIGHKHQILLGKDGSTNDTGAMTFNYQGNASSANYLSFGLWGTTSLFITGGGNVGISTATPGAKLQVDDGSGRNLQIAPSGSGIDIISTTNPMRLITSDASHMTFSTDGTSNERMRIMNTGNVGIGTTSPEYALHVEGSSVSSGGGLAVLCATDTSTAYNGTNPGGGITFRGKYNNGGSITNFGTVQAVKENTTDGNYDTALRFTTRANGGNLTERMRIDSSGRVGINNNTPGNYLTSDLVVGDTTGDNAITVVSGNANASGIFFQDTTGVSIISGVRYQHDINKMGLWTNGGERVVINSSGNVGINNTDPTDRLTLTVGNGGGILQSTYYSGSVTSGQKLGVIGFKGYSQGNTVAGADAKIEAIAASNHSGSSAPAHLDFYTKDDSIGPGSGATRRFRIDEYGAAMIHASKNNWSRLVQSDNTNIHYRLYGASSSTTTYNLLRYRRHYWGSGSVHITLFQTYYSTTSQGEYWLYGHGRSDGSYNPNYGIAYQDIYNGPGSGRLSINLPGGAPGNSVAEIVDVSISIPAYVYYLVKIQVSHSDWNPTTTTMPGANSYALHA